MQPYQQLLPINSVCVVDVTFFGKRNHRDHFWILSVYSCTYKRVIYAKEIATETVEEYQKCHGELRLHGWTIDIMVCDGKPGVMKYFQEQWISVQMCHFHLHGIITRKIGLYPKIAQWKALKQVVHMLKNTNYDLFYGAYMQTLISHYSFINERYDTPLKKRKWRYKHEKIRSAYMSILKFLPNLFTYQTIPFCFSKCPNTTNHLDGGVFSHLKEKTNLHRWKTKKRKIAIIFELLFKINIRKK
jgi:hypothetical protein